MNPSTDVCRLADPTLELVLACAHLHSSDAVRQRIHTLLGPSPSHATPQWDRFLELVRWHRIAPLVLKTLNETALDAIPPEVHSGLAGLVRDNTRRALVQGSELTRLASLFDAAGIRFLLLKGPGLALQGYGDLGLRHAGDLDLLLADTADLEKAHALLVNTGYEQTCPGFKLSPRQRQAYIGSHQDFGYLHRGYGLRVELHWRWTENPHLFPLDPLRARERSRTLTMGGIDIHVPNNEDLLLYLCVHGAKHAWFRLLWLCDLPILAQTARPPIDVDTLARRARELGVSNLLQQGLGLARYLLRVSLPDPLTALSTTKDLNRYAIRFPCRAITLGPAFRNQRLPLGLSLDQFRYRAALRKEFRYKRRELTCYTVRFQDWRLLRLPDRLFALYPLLRPGLWALRRFTSRTDNTANKHSPPPPAREE